MTHAYVAASKKIIATMEFSPAMQAELARYRDDNSIKTRLGKLFHRRPATQTKINDIIKQTSASILSKLKN